MVGTNACSGLRPTGFDLASESEATALGPPTNILIDSDAAFVAGFFKNPATNLVAL